MPLQTPPVKSATVVLASFRGQAKIRPNHRPTIYLRQREQVGAFVGHSKLETTMTYVHLAGTDVQEYHARYSPVRTLGLGI